MAKKIVEVEDKKSNLDLGKITKSIMENKEALGKIADGIGDLIDGKPSKKTSKKTIKKTSKKNETDSMSTVIDIASTLLKK